MAFGAPSPYPEPKPVAKPTTLLAYSAAPAVAYSSYHVPVAYNAYPQYAIPAAYAYSAPIVYA